MQRPERISREDTMEILYLISLVAQEPDRLDENKQNTKKGKEFARTLNDFLSKSNIYQYELPELPNSKIVLTEDVYRRLCGFATCSNFSEKYQNEFGGYLFGRTIDDNNILFDRVNMEVNSEEARKFITSDAMSREIERTMQDDEVNCVCHVHTHPYAKGLFSGTPSNQDLYTYAWFQEQFNETDKNVFFMGALITPTENTRDAFNDICFIFYDKKVKRFYKITNIYYKTNDGEEVALSKKDYKQVRNGKVESVEQRTVLMKQYN